MLSSSPDQSTITLRSRRRPRVASLCIISDSPSLSYPDVASPITPIHQISSSIPIYSPLTSSPRKIHTLRPRPTPKSPPPSAFTFSPSPDDMPHLPYHLPPTPTPSIESPSQRNSHQKLQTLAVAANKAKMFETLEAGPSRTIFRPYSSAPPREHPPTPPVIDDEAISPTASRFDSHTINFSEPSRPERTYRHPARRPASTYPAQVDAPTYLPPQRKYTDPTPHRRYSFTSETSPNPQQLDVDLEAYATSEYDTAIPLEYEPEGREPTLSFVTTSTVESTTSSPSIGAYAFKSESDGKPQEEPRIRMRTTTGRANAYSSAESSTASGAFSSYHAFSDHSVYHPHPPPLPVLPAEHVGLGISALPSQAGAKVDSPLPLMPTSASFTRQPPWMNRLRSDSNTSSITSTSTSTSDSGDAQPYPYGGFDDSPKRPWDVDDDRVRSSEPEAVNLVVEGREKILNTEKLENMGGLDAMTPEVIESLAGDLAGLRKVAELTRPGITHLLLPACGPGIAEILSHLLLVLSPTLVVLDLSCNDLTHLPQDLALCTSLEELNLSDNHLRKLPSWLSELLALRVLVVDGCGIQNLPFEISQLIGLHTICARRNRMVALPSWLCLLDRLDTFKVDDNPFSEYWIKIVAPILSSPVAPVSPPPIPPRTTSYKSRSGGDSIRSMTSLQSLASTNTLSSVGSRDMIASSSTTSMFEPKWSGLSPAAGTSRQLPGLGPIQEDIHPHSAPLRRLAESSETIYSPLHDTQPEMVPLSTASSTGGLRKMRSAGNLIGRRPSTPQTLNDHIHPPATVLAPPPVGRFASLGSSDGRRATSAMGNYAEVDEHPNLAAPSMTASTSAKGGKWGFLRKMSMNRLKPEKTSSSTLSASASANLQLMPPLLQHANSEPTSQPNGRPFPLAHKSAITLPTRKTLGVSMEASEFGSTTLKAMPSTLSSGALPSSFNMFGNGSSATATTTRGKRRSFLPIDSSPPSINVSIPSVSPFMPPNAIFSSGSADTLPPAVSQDSINDTTVMMESTGLVVESLSTELDPDIMYQKGLESIKSYLRDLYDLSRPPIEPYGGFEVVGTADSNCASSDRPMSPTSNTASSTRRARRPTLENDLSRNGSILSASDKSLAEEVSSSGKRFKNDKIKRARVVREIYESERSYVRGLGELVSIYVRPSSQLVNPGKPGTETIIPVAERKIVFGGAESILSIHRDNLLPAIEKAVKPLLEGTDDEDGNLSAQSAHAVGQVFRTYIAYMKQYSTYINNFDNALSRMKTWIATSSAPSTPGLIASKPGSPNTGSISQAAISVGMGMSSVSLPMSDGVSHGGGQLSASQKKRVKAFLKRCREHPKHSQINLESYLLLPIQRVPRYKLLLEDLAMCTPPRADGPSDTLDDALADIASLATTMNEEKRDAESRLRLFHWQQRITSRGPSPLVQPHRKLILDGSLNLIRLVKKASTFVEVDTLPTYDTEHTITAAPASGKAVVQVEHISPEPMDRPMMLILCTDLLVLVQQRGDGWNGDVDLFSVLRMATMREPASIVHNNVLRVVDNKSIYYFNGISDSNTLQWCRAINQQSRR
ncbi:hypothetical protein P7C73_g3063, partial [Tremellales sp. Uapishka_1]